MPRFICAAAGLRVTGYDMVRISLALVLLAAAALKGYQLATEPVLARGILDSRWFLILVVQFELLFGLWLLAGLYPTWTRLAAILCFACFAGVSGVKAFLGEASCGCFGPVPVPPRYILALDLAAVLALALCPPSKRSGQSPGDATLPVLQLRAWAVLAIWTAVALPAGFMMASNHDSPSINEAAVVAEDGRVVVLLPAEWQGKRFPVIEHVESPPYGDRSSSPFLCVLGRLFPAKDWFFSAPMILLVGKGTVMTVSRVPEPPTITSTRDPLPFPF